MEGIDNKERFPYMYNKHKTRDDKSKLRLSMKGEDHLATNYKDTLHTDAIPEEVEPLDGDATRRLTKNNSSCIVIVDNQSVSSKKKRDLHKKHHHHHHDKHGKMAKDKHPNNNSKSINQYTEEMDFFKNDEFQFVQNIEKDKLNQRLGRFEVYNKHVYYSETSLFIFSTNSKFRKYAVLAMEWQWFDRIILAAILITTVALALYDYKDRDSTTSQNQTVDWVLFFMTLIFFLEAAIKITSMGFVIHKFSYLRDLWNLMDFIIVVLGIIDLMAIGINLKALRILRVLRPLRSLKAIPSMRLLVSTLFKSIPEVGNAAIFIIFMTMLFSILGLQQFLGITYYRCRLTEKPLNATYWPKSPIYTRVCSQDGNGAYTCPSGTYCGSPIEYGISLEDDNVYSDPKVLYGIGAFNNFGSSLLAVIQSISSEEWTTHMYNISDGYTPLFTQIYFCTLVLFGHYYLLQLILAVIISNLSKILTNEAYEDISKKKEIMDKDKILLEERKKLENVAAEEQGQFPKTEEDQGASEQADYSPQKQKYFHRQNSGISKSTVPLSNGQTNQDFKSAESSQRQTMVFGNSQSKNIFLQNMKSEQNLQSALRRLPSKMMSHTPPPQHHSNQNQVKKQLHHFQSVELQSAYHSPRKSAQGGGFDDSMEREELNEPEDKPTEKAGSVDQRIQNTFLFGLDQELNQKPEEISRGVGLALLSKFLGVKEIENQFEKFNEKIKESLEQDNLEKRLQVQNRIREDLKILNNKMEFDVTKKYHMSKKSVYGIDNEIHLIEQVQNNLKEIIDQDKLRNGELTLFDAVEERNFARRIQYERSNIYGESGNNTRPPTPKHDEYERVPQLNEHMQVTLRIAYNLKELNKQQDVRKFFSSRFKKALVKKNLLEKIYNRVDKHIKASEYANRANLSNKLIQLCYKLQDSKWFTFTSTMLICANAIVLMLNGYPIDLEREKILDALNIFFFFFFVLEILIKMGGRGLAYFFREQFNWFDTAVVLVSAINLVLQLTINFSEQDGGALTSLRLFRLVRVFQLAKVWREFNLLLVGVQNTLKDISNMTILMCIFILINMLVGMELYAYRVKFNKETNEVDLSEEGVYPRSNFNTLIEAFLSVFIVLANDGWTQVYFHHYRSSNPFISTMYFMGILFIGQYMLLNLFIATLIENFEEISVRSNFQHSLHLGGKEEDENLKEKLQRLYRKCRRLKKVQPQDKQAIFDKEDQHKLNDEEIQELQQEKENIQYKSPSLFIFTHKSCFRKTIRKLVHHKYFEILMMVIIILSTAQLAIDNPLNNPDDLLSKILANLESILTGMFLIEACLKIVAHGFMLNGPKSYIFNRWNFIDVIVLSITVSSYLISSKNLNSIKAFRLLKVLRPLRVISRNQGLKISIRALSVALGSIINVIIVSMLFYCMFGIIGVSYFKGKYFDCDVRHFSAYFVDFQSLIDTKWDCLNHGGEWIKSIMNFDDIWHAMSTLFIMSNTVMWSEIMYQGAFSRGIDLAPANHFVSYYAAAFFVIVIVIGNFFLMNVFVGVIITKYNREKELMGKGFMLTEEQKKAVKKSMMILLSQPKFSMKLPHSEWRQPFYYIADNRIFQGFTLICILVNTVLLLLEWVSKPVYLDSFLDPLNYLFAGIFTIEFLIKYIGYGNRVFRDQWNVFDMMIVIITIASIVLSRSSSYQIGPQTTVIRSFRIARLFYFFKRNKALKRTFQTFIVTLPSMANIGSLLFLIIFIYAILGVYLFAPVKLYGELNQKANFQSIGTALITLIRVITGEKWPLIYETLSRKSDLQFQCIENPSYQDYKNNNYETIGCGDQFFATAYFFSYVLIIVMVFLRLFIAIVIQAFAEIAEKDSKFLSTSLTENFREVWSRFDPDATSFIQVRSFPRFLVALGEPLGWDMILIFQSTIDRWNTNSWMSSRTQS